MTDKIVDFDVKHQLEQNRTQLGQTSAKCVRLYALTSLSKES